MSEFANMTDAEARSAAQRAQEDLITTLRQQVALQRGIIERYEAADAWRSAIRSGTATLEQMQHAFDLEDQGEVSNPLPKGYLRNPEGELVRVDPSGEPVSAPETPTTDDAFDVSQTFLGRA